MIATAPIGSTSAAPIVAVPETALNLPAEPRRSRRNRTTAVLVDTREPGSTITAIRPESAPADPADRPRADPHGMPRQWAPHAAKAQVAAFPPTHT